MGGKLEVKIRVRDPFINKQVESVNEKWLVIDQFERKEAPQPVVRTMYSLLRLPSLLYVLHTLS